MLKKFSKKSLCVGGELREDLQKILTVREEFLSTKTRVVSYSFSPDADCGGIFSNFSSGAVI